MVPLSHPVDAEDVGVSPPNDLCSLPVVMVTMQKSWHHDEVVKAVAAAVSSSFAADKAVPSEFVRLTQYSRTKGPFDVIRSDSVRPLSEWIFLDRILLYEVLPIPLKEIESKVTVAFTVCDLDDLSQRTVEFTDRTDLLLKDALSQLLRSGQLRKKSSDCPLSLPIRVVGIVSSSIFTEFSVDSTPLADIGRWQGSYASRIVRLEEIPANQRSGEMKSGSRLVEVHHITKFGGMITPHGVPFYSVVDSETKMGDIRQIMAKKLKAVDEEVVKWRVGAYQYGSVVFAKDEDLASKVLREAAIYTAAKVVLAVEHKQTPTTPSATSPTSTTTSTTSTTSTTTSTSTSGCRKEREVRIYN